MNINQQIAIKGAELLKIYYSYNLYSGDMYVIHDNESIPREFDPINNANDMNKLIEALNIDVVLRDTNDGTVPNWLASTFYSTHKAHSKSRDEAISQCVIKALGVDND